MAKLNEKERAELREEMKIDFIKILGNHAGYFYTWFGTTHLEVDYDPAERKFLITVDDKKCEITEKNSRPRF